MVCFWQASRQVFLFFFFLLWNGRRQACRAGLAWLDLTWQAGRDTGLCLA
jgi:hypothetical protein